MTSRTFIYILFLFTASCISVEICDDDYNSVMVARFMTMKDGAAADSTVSSFSLYGIREGKPDSLLYNQTPSLAEFEVPLDPHHDMTRLVLHLGEQTDTLELSHQQEVYMISYDCGFGNLFTLGSVGYKTGMIKSVEIIDEKVDAETEEDDLHIWLFL